MSQERSQSPLIPIGCRPAVAVMFVLCAPGAVLHTGLTFAQETPVSETSQNASTSNAVTDGPESDSSSAAANPRTISQSDTTSFQATEFDLPESTAGILLMSAILIGVSAVVIRTSLRDSRFLTTFQRILLLVPRLCVLAIVLLIALNPQQRTQISRIEKSRVDLLLDTSLSMAYPAEEATSPGASQGSPATPSADADVAQPTATSAVPTDASRAEAIGTALLQDGLLKQLSETHVVSLYTFDGGLSGPAAVVTDGKIRFVTEASSSRKSSASDSGGDSSVAQLSLDDADDAAESFDLAGENVSRSLTELLQPRGAETRLGESLHALIGQSAGRTLSGVVVVTDGRGNAGLDPMQAHERASRSGTRLITLGVGSRRPQMNFWIAGMQSPTDVHNGDPFEINVVVQSSNANGESAVVRLFQQSAGSDGKDRRQVDEKTIEIADSTVPVTVSFPQRITVPGQFEYVAMVELVDPQKSEITLADNERRREVEVTDRRMNVLLISSGPMRDYQFVRNTLFRHSGIESDVWLQSVTEENSDMVSQESRQLLLEFPRTEALLAEYDVIVAFDPDWSRLSTEQQEWLNRWVERHAGGLIVVAGEIFTPRMAQDVEAFKNIAVLYPVLLNRMLPELSLRQGADKAWPVGLTPDGRSSEFLKITDEQGNASTELWTSFEGIYRSYPVRGVRDGATVLLEYGNPRARTELGQPPFLAAQFYGAGRTIFLGSAETWRIRQISPQGHQQFWTSLIREAGQARRSRGTTRGLLLLDRTEASPGQPVNIRAQLYNSQMQPLRTESVTMSIIDAEGRPVSVPDRLMADGRGNGQYVNNFRPPRPGSYRITVPIPESSDILQASIEVLLPNLESQEPTQNVALLRSLPENTDGGYLSLTDAASQLASMLPDRSEPSVVDEQLRTLWDKSWLLFAAAGLLAFEWAMRRIFRLS
ncbi:MAG: hypothetical protein KDA96_00645 [Planctomycetaceae bacterium]|nr:hypothetical protein [Planctomycetaceae bacterium]